VEDTVKKMEASDLPKVEEEQQKVEVLIGEEGELIKEEVKDAKKFLFDNSLEATAPRLAKEEEDEKEDN
jgi:hypothetical protein